MNEELGKIGCRWNGCNNNVSTMICASTIPKIPTSLKKCRKAKNNQIQV
jgi:hypothetical protein